jgi:hypothetical protein
VAGSTDMPQTAIGVTTGGMAAASTLTQPPQVSPFSTVAHLAPSTLLEGE